ncbi:ParB/RepB/Spo0J family partition protein [Bifidobacterium sp. ESL0790]|uniref:ParB/RepB/Spo0J family partition protein n=1 Tax=Bifidobacterium sp. ESL0790 TaxID=2983233 RepID=UPI0023F891A5|nr:ParB/RepB/Spo0J family partition protein [Bifidobacterium sp. ESL0790]WEV72125.1 ParB/RepB/Spo0J family partition protein [Bifidobacterium sp. ESL0790]
MSASKPTKTANTIQMLKVTDLHPHPDNPRKDVGDVSELADSIKAQGVRQNLLVVPNPDGKGWRVVIGHRRLAAAKLAGLTQVPCVVDETLDAKRQLELMIVENCQRSDLKPIEEADAYQGLLDLGSTAPKIAKQTGRSAKYVRGRLKMATIPDDVRAKSKDFTQLSVSDLEALAEFEDDPESQAELAEKAGTDNWGYKLDQLRERRMERKWSAAARLVVDDLGLKVEELEGDPYGHHDGYRWPDLIYPMKSETFKYQWLGWLNMHDDPDPLIRVRHDPHGIDRYWVYEHNAEDASKEEKHKEEEKKRKAEERARTQPIMDLDNASRKLRGQWLHANLHSLTEAQWRKAVSTIFLHFMLGDGVYYFNSGASAISYKAFIKAYNLISGCKLDDKSDTGFIATTTFKELQDRQGKNPEHETILALFADWEAEIWWSLWDDEDDRKTTIQPYYDLLESIGYPVSDAEKQALAGEFGKDVS